ncbi:glycosyltransferase [Blastococcus sp. MG754426]|uniref:glycosyltransferase family 2 protein n=1 Tax=unclassified Blastococcus TaxID=2619396 RepID=UPI001EF0F2B8|nr:MULTISPECIES: glycosyltransferase [unclassified Blastococcus]MCF6506291.1 glycosyltransferase [Blastococcus sp. MG754426]MCF6510893.1 glycosyltransferase [Blastococcus sp. MG754427]MCF6733859.1 glycosyltransferase [Blastococcus sp. KM273129]
MSTTGTSSAASTGNRAVGPDPRVAVVVITHQRRDELLLALDRLVALPEQPHVVVVDNGSTDGTAEAVRARFPQVELVASPENLGAVGRNLGVARLGTPYVAFCDDDTWWEPGSLRAAADVLDAHPRLAVVTARILVEPGGTEDPIVAELRDSPVVGADWLPGPALGSFLAGASVLRRDAFDEVGGFSERLWLGGEEELMAGDLAARGWELCYLQQLTLHHQASTARDPHKRRADGIRNTLWTTWLRRPLRPALRRTLHLLRTVPRDRVTALGIARAVRGLPWVLRERRVLPPHAEARFAALEEAQRNSTARRYVS